MIVTSLLCFAAIVILIKNWQLSAALVLVAGGIVWRLAPVAIILGLIWLAMVFGA